jgi:hypothetical protein
VTTSKSQLQKFGCRLIQTNSHNSTPVGFYVVSTCDVAFIVETSKNDREADADADVDSDLHITMSITLEPDEPDTQKKRQAHLVP